MLPTKTDDEPTVQPISPESSHKLFRMNMFLAVFHIATGIILAAITDKDSTAPSYVNFANPDTRGKPGLWGPSPKKLSDVIVGYFSATFLLLAGIDHLLVATIGRRLYESQLAKKQNHFRWLEYFWSASFMNIMIAYLSGIFDIHLQVAIFCLTATTMIFGSEMERNNWHLWGNPAKKSFLPFWYGFVPFIAAWLIISCYFFYGVSHGSPPGFVWAIIFILFFLESTFAVNQWLQQKEIGKWKDYLYGEWVFLILSLVAKQLLAWINYGGSRSLST